MKLNVQIGVSSVDEGNEYVKLVEQAGIPGLQASVSEGKSGGVVSLTMNTVQKVQKAGQVSAVAS